MSDKQTFNIPHSHSLSPQHGDKLHLVLEHYAPPKDERFKLVIYCFTRECNTRPGLVALGGEAIYFYETNNDELILSHIKFLEKRFKLFYSPSIIGFLLKKEFGSHTHSLNPNKKDDEVMLIQEAIGMLSGFFSKQEKGLHGLENLSLAAQNLLKILRDNNYSSPLINQLINDKKDQ